MPLFRGIHGELWLKSQVSLRRPLQNPAHPPKGKADFVPKGYCFKFHKDRKCLPSCTPCRSSVGSMVSCGLSHKFPFVDHSKTQLIHQKERQILSQKDIVLNSRRTASVFLVVLLSTFATGVRGHTQFQNVIFVAHQKLPVLSPDLLSPPYRHPSLPTPVKGERLGFLLEGYTPSTVEFLLFGFTQGFPVHFQGERKSRTATVCCPVSGRYQYPDT